MSGVFGPAEAQHRQVLMLLFTSLLHDGRVQREATTLLAAGFDVTIINVVDPRSEQSLTDAAGEWRACRERLHGVSIKNVALISKGLQWLPRLLRRPAQVVELFVRFLPTVLGRRWFAVHSHELPPAIFALLAQAIRGSHVVYDAHELEVPMNQEKHHRFRLWYESLALRRASIAMTVNEPIAALLQRRSKRAVAVIPNRPLKVPHGALRSGRWRAQLSLTPSDVLIMYVGHVSPWARGVEVVMQAMSRLPSHFHFAVIAVGRVDEFRSHLDSIDGLDVHVTSRVHFLAAVPPDDVPLALSDADISVMLYRGDKQNEQLNSPNKLYQSIIAQVPILASANETFPAVVRLHPAGPIGEVADPKSPVAVAEALVRLSAPHAASEYRQAAATISPEVSWDASARELVSLYSTLTPPSPDSRRPQ